MVAVPAFKDLMHFGSVITLAVGALPVVDHIARHAARPEDLSQRAFYPMTLPLTVGPGSISVALTLGANPPAGIRPLLFTALAHALGISLVALGVYCCYRDADRILRRPGTIGAGVVVRLTAFILLCVGVQLCSNGLQALLAGEVPHSTVGCVRPNMAHSFKSRAGEIDNLRSGV